MSIIQTQISEKISIKGGLESENNLHRERVAKRKELIQSFIKKYSFGLRRFNLSDFQVNIFDDYTANSFISKLEQQVSVKLKHINSERVFHP